MHIREGKGRVDRIVPVSSKVWDKLDEYVDGFKPVKYLFEGHRGGRYSVESVYRVFKAALNRAGIRRKSGYIVAGTVMLLIFMNQVWISGIYRNC